MGIIDAVFPPALPPAATHAKTLPPSAGRALQSAALPIAAADESPLPDGLSISLTVLD